MTTREREHSTTYPNIERLPRDLRIHIYRCFLTFNELVVYDTAMTTTDTSKGETKSIQQRVQGRREILQSDIAFLVSMDPFSRSSGRGLTLTFTLTVNQVIWVLRRKYTLSNRLWIALANSSEVQLDCRRWGIYFQKSPPVVDIYIALQRLLLWGTLAANIYPEILLIMEQVLQAMSMLYQYNCYNKDRGVDAMQHYGYFGKRNALLHSCAIGNISMVQLLLSASVHANPNVYDSQSRSPLHLSSYRTLGTFISEPIYLNIDICAASMSDVSTLTLVSAGGGSRILNSSYYMHACILELLAAGCDFTTKDVYGKTACNYAMESGRRRTSHLLQKLEVEVEVEVGRQSQSKVEN
jgi:hypothetical protein